jgi:single-strand DNA-binding protein
MFSQTILVGRLGKDPESREVGNTTVTNFSVATDYSFKNREGEWTKETEWHNITVWAAQAKACAQYLKKGSLVQVIGRIKTEKYEKNGETKYAVKIVADRVNFLDTKKTGPDYGNEGFDESRTAAGVAKERAASRPVAATTLIDDSDIPF